MTMHDLDGDAVRRLGPRDPVAGDARERRHRRSHHALSGLERRRGGQLPCACAVAGIYAPGVGYQFIFGHAGALALSGHVHGRRRLSSGILAVSYGVPFDLALPISVGLPVLLALIVAAPVLRLETHYFALATLIISQVVLLIAVEWISFTGGANGIGGVSPIQIVGATIPAGWPLLATVWGFVAFGALLAWQSPVAAGQAWACVRTAPRPPPRSG